MTEPTREMRHVTLGSLEFDQKCSTSLPVGNQVDGLPTASSQMLLRALAQAGPRRFAFLLNIAAEGFL